MTNPCRAASGRPRLSDQERATRADIACDLHAAVHDQTTLDRGVWQTLLAAALRGRQADQAVSLLTGPWPDGLTDREGEVLALIAAGHDNREIAARLVIGTSTVKTHINRIFAKIGVTNRRGAIAYLRHTHGDPPDDHDLRP